MAVRQNAFGKFDFHRFIYFLAQNIQMRTFFILKVHEDKKELLEVTVRGRRGLKNSNNNFFMGIEF